jgi:hypothetical protein
MNVIMEDEAVLLMQQYPVSSKNLPEGGVGPKQFRVFGDRADLGEHYDVEVGNIELVDHLLVVGSADDGVLPVGKLEDGVEEKGF